MLRPVNRMHACMLSCFSHVQLFGTPWTVAWHSPLSIGLSSQEYWSGLPCPPPGNLPNPRIKPILCLLHWRTGSLPLVPPGKPVNRTEHRSKLSISIQSVDFQQMEEREKQVHCSQEVQVEILRVVVEKVLGLGRRLSGSCSSAKVGGKREEHLQWKRNWR